MLKSDRNSTDSHIWWHWHLTIFRRGIAFLVKVLPGWITIYPHCNDPIKDSSSLHVQDFRHSHCVRVSRSLFNFSSGSLNSWLLVSMVVPRNVMTELGHSCFPDANGTPRSLQTLWSIWRLYPHTSELDGPRTIKSSTLPAPLLLPCTILKYLLWAMKIFGADCKPKGNLESTYIWSFQHIPKHIRSRGEMGTNLYADFISI